MVPSHKKRCGGMTRPTPPCGAAEGSGLRAAGIALSQEEEAGRPSLTDRVTVSAPAVRHPLHLFSFGLMGHGNVGGERECNGV